MRPPDSLREVELIRSMGVQFEQNVQIPAGMHLELLEKRFDAIFIGAGLGPTESPGLAGEQTQGVVDALHFIADYKTGRVTRISGRVVVIGGGNTAIDAANAAPPLRAREAPMPSRQS